MKCRPIKALLAFMCVLITCTLFKHTINLLRLFAIIKGLLDLDDACIHWVLGHNPLTNSHRSFLFRRGEIWIKFIILCSLENPKRHVNHTSRCGSDLMICRIHPTASIVGVDYTACCVNRLCHHHIESFIVINAILIQLKLSQRRSSGRSCLFVTMNPVAGAAIANETLSRRSMWSTVPSLPFFN